MVHVHRLCFNFVEFGERKRRPRLISTTFPEFGKGGRNKPKRPKHASAYFDHLSGGGRNKPKRPKHASAYFDHLFRTTENAVKVGQSSPWPSFDSTLKCTDSACRPYQKFRKLDRDRPGLHLLVSNSCLASIDHIHLFQSPPVIMYSTK